MATKTKTAPAVDAPKLTKVQRVARIIELREQAKAMYAEAEALESGLLERMGVGEQVKLPDGRIVQLIDKFADKNLVWAHASVRRFSLEIPK